VARPGQLPGLVIDAGVSELGNQAKADAADEQA
jgi:hypothetical protein